MVNGCYSKDSIQILCSECNKHDVICAGANAQKEQKTLEEVMKGMNEPKEFLKDDVVSLVVDFINNDNFYDQTFFDVDCSKNTWRDEFLTLWNEFRKDENLPEACVTEAWSTCTDDPEYFI